MIPLLYSSICSAIRTHWQALGVYGSRAYVSASVSASVLRIHHANAEQSMGASV